MNEVISDIVVNKENIKRNLELTHGLIFSQRVLLKLVEKGLSRESAYRIVQDNAMKSWKTSVDLKELLRKDKRTIGKISPGEIENIFDFESILKNVNSVFKRVGI
jgi:adenylosuccinate lyase